ncbi:hypothetical protein JG688_00008148 [Phytophthora aleatoria]|uniref:Uncharacterized protein n=1 Tax=Phytophthora aleatoria TaxID=2496075 RepID=A0A8J5MG93_9STRA|nr:hypothetical protein JG688_00008148 [Phytophthora aleatoria]
MGNCVLGQTSRQCRHRRQGAHDSHDDCLTLRIQSLNENSKRLIYGVTGASCWQLQLFKLVICTAAPHKVTTVLW